MLLLLQRQRGLPCRHLRGRIAVVCPIRLRIDRRLPSRRKCLWRRVSHHHANHVCVCIRRSSPRTPPKASVVIVRLSILLVHRLGPPRRKRRVFVRILRRTTPVVRLFVDFDAPSPQPGLQELRKLLWHGPNRPGGRFWSGAQGVVKPSGLVCKWKRKLFFVSSRSQSRGDRRSPMKNEVDGTHSFSAQHTTAARRAHKRQMLLLSTRLGREVLCVKATLTFAWLFALLFRGSAAHDTETQEELVEALCDTPSWELVDTLVSLPMFGDDALKASSRFPGLRRFSPSQGNLSVRPQLPKRSLSRLFSVSR